MQIHPSGMIKALLLALASSVSGAALADEACVPILARDGASAPSALGEHRALRLEMHEPMPQASTMILLYGAGGHMEARWYSIVLTRDDDDGLWHGTAIGRSQTWIKNAPYSPMNRKAWTLDKVAGEQLDAAINRTCPRRSIVKGARLTPPPLNYITRRIDIIRSHEPLDTFDVDEAGQALAAMILPPL